MCGIAGYIAKEVVPMRFQVAAALLAHGIEDRGPQSWGATDGSTHVKKVGSIIDTMSVPAVMPLSFVLHTRYATAGAKTEENCHPFEMQGKLGKIVGVHNGIIDNHDRLDVMYKPFEVDSQHIFNLLVEGESLNILQGYGAIVYKLNDEWFIGRFNNGDMEVVETPHGLFFASTMNALVNALSMAGIEINKVLNVKNNAIYRITPEGLKKAFKIRASQTDRRWNDNYFDAFKDEDFTHSYGTRRDAHDVSIGARSDTYKAGGNWGGRFRAGQPARMHQVTSTKALPPTVSEPTSLTTPKDNLCEVCGTNPSSNVFYLIGEKWNCSTCMCNDTSAPLTSIYYGESGKFVSLVRSDKALTISDGQPKSLWVKCVNCTDEFDALKVDDARDGLYCDRCHRALNRKDTKSEIVDIEQFDIAEDDALNCELCDDPLYIGETAYRVTESVVSASSDEEDEEEETLICARCYAQACVMSKKKSYEPLSDTQIREIVDGASKFLLQ